MNFDFKKQDFQLEGVSIIDDVFTQKEIQSILDCIHSSSQKSDSFLKSTNLFAIRQLLNEIPSLQTHLFNGNLKAIISEFGGANYFLTKAIYFDKPPQSNWFVAYHQDLSISVKNRVETDNYIHWTQKRGQIGVQPPLNVLENILTIRIHLDDTTLENGALRVIPKSHLKGIYRPENIDWTIETEQICEVKRGGVMLMSPLTLHASSKSTSKLQRRVIHLEFSNIELAKPLEWLEKKAI